MSLWSLSFQTSRCGKNISDTLSRALCTTGLFLPYFNVICDLLLNKRSATWDIFVNLNPGRTIDRAVL